MNPTAPKRTAAVLNIELLKPHESTADSPTSTHATTRDHDRRSENKTKQASIDQVEAQLWQLDQFLRGERKHQPDTEGVLHAQRTELGIQLYIRPKANGFFCVLFDSIKNGEKQKLAAETLAGLANTYKTNCAASGSPSPKFKAPSLDFLMKPAASVEVNAIAPGLEEIAIAISNKYFIKEGKPAHSIQETMGHILRDALNINSRTVTSDTNNALVKLAVFGFSFAEIKSFSKLVNNIIGLENASEDLRKIDEFKEHWIKKCDDNTAAGKEFRKFVIDNSEFGAWNLVAHYLANGTTPKFDLRSYAGYDCVMVPQTSEMVWSEVLNDRGRTYSNVEKLHTDAAKDANVQCMRSANSGPKLFAAESLVIDPKITELSFEQNRHLEMAYRTVITIPAMHDDDSLFVLTPLFNYTENTIDACVSLMLRPLKQALKKGNASLKLHLFSTDPRIVEKFYDALRKLQENAKKDTAAVTPYRAAISTSTSTWTSTSTSTATSTSTSTSAPAHSASAALTDESASSLESILDAISNVPDELEKVAKKIPSQVGKVTKEVSNKAGEVTTKFSSQVGGLTRDVSNQVGELTKKVANNIGEVNKVAHSLSKKIRTETNRFIEYENGEINNITWREFDGECPATAEVALDYTPAAVVSPASRKASNPLEKRRKIRVRSPIAAVIVPAATEAQKIPKEIKLQIGITASNWLPDESTVLMLTRLSPKFLQPDQTQLKQGLEKLVKSDEFDACVENSFMFKKDGRNIVPVKELSIDNSIGLFESGKENDVLLEIVNAYKVICKNASIADVKKIVLSPCFSLADTNRIRFDRRYEDAITMMLDTINKSLVEFPQLDITLVARSEKEHALMQKTMTDLKQKKQTAY